MKNRKIILFELNEVAFRVIDLFCQQHPDSTLAKYLPKCSQYTTYAQDTKLSPWITWPTLHRGVTDVHHGIKHIGQNVSEVDTKFPPIWDTLTANGVKCGIFGSLHTYPLPNNTENYSFYVPDTFASGSECIPEEISVFQEFNLQMARSSPRNVSKSIPVKSALGVLAKIPQLGIRVKTMVDTAKQLVSERLEPWKGNRRRSYQSILAFDLFLKQLKEKQPDFATFFTNHVASAMHRYWAACFPDDYESLGFSDEWLDRYKNEIDWAMNKFDGFLAELVSFVEEHPEYTLWIATSMGQAANHGDPLKTQLYLTKVDKFMEFLGIPADGWSRLPAMEPDVGIQVNEEWVKHFADQVSQMTIEGQAVKYHQKRSWFLPCTIWTKKFGRSLRF